MAGVDRTRNLAAHPGDEINVNHEIVVAGDRLQILNPRAEPVPMKPLGPDTFDSAAGQGVFRRNAQGQVDAVVYSAGRVLNVVFERQSPPGK